MVCRGALLAVVATLFFAVAQVAVVPNAAAFETSRSEYGTRLRLTSLPVRVRLDTPAPGFSDGGQAALLRAIASWNKRSGSSTLLVLTDDDDALVEIVFVSNNWQFGSAIAAHTAVESDLFQGDIRHVIIEIDANRNWADPSTVPANALDLESVFLHELGHSLGLAHSFHDDAVMRAGIKPGQSRRQLHEDDVAAISSITKYSGFGEVKPSLPLRRWFLSSAGLFVMWLFFVAGAITIVGAVARRTSKWVMARRTP